MAPRLLRNHPEKAWLPTYTAAPRPMTAHPNSTEGDGPTHESTRNLVRTTPIVSLGPTTQTRAAPTPHPGPSKRGRARRRNTTFDVSGQNPDVTGRPVTQPPDATAPAGNSRRRIVYSPGMLDSDRTPARDDATRSLVRDRDRTPLPVVIKVVTSGQTYRLSQGGCVLGAGRDADLVVEGATVSRKHAQLTLDAEGVLISDLGSRNGTFYLGQRIGELVVAPGTTITLGDVEVRIEADAAALRVADGPESYGAMIARSPAMRRLFSILQRLEGSLVNVLIQGESGTGKELLARAIHDNSSVADGPFVAVNCGALERELVRSELFGHRRGAFTGAIESRIGAFEAADGGTLFLDEVGELPTDVQPMLLRALEDRSIVRVGENTPRNVRVRLVAATNRKLEEQVTEGVFREDLYYRLMVVRLEVPALRDRPEDIPALADWFAERSGGAQLPPSVLTQLTGHFWPGNVRELRHAVESYLAIGVLPFGAPSARASLDRYLLPYVDLERPYQDLKGEIVDAFTRVYLTRLLAHTGGNVSTAARISGVERSYLNKLARRLGVKA